MFCLPTTAHRQTGPPGSGQAQRIRDSYSRAPLHNAWPAQALLKFRGRWGQTWKTCLEDMGRSLCRAGVGGTGYLPEPVVLASGTTGQGPGHRGGSAVRRAGFLQEETLDRWVGLSRRPGQRVQSGGERQEAPRGKRGQLRKNGPPQGRAPRLNQSGHQSPGSGPWRPAPPGPPGPATGVSAGRLRPHGRPLGRV